MIKIYYTSVCYVLGFHWTSWRSWEVLEDPFMFHSEEFKQQRTRTCVNSTEVGAITFKETRGTLEILYNKEICHLQLKKRILIRPSSKLYYKSGQRSADFVTVVRVHKPSSCPTDYTFCFFIHVLNQYHLNTFQGTSE